MIVLNIGVFLVIVAVSFISGFLFGKFSKKNS